MEIKIGTGIRNIVFGMTQDEIETILGKPDKVIETETPGWITYEYQDDM